MTTDRFYHVVSLNGTAGHAVAGIRFYAGHAIFKGHFPGQPVVPGVCMIQMVKDLLEQAVLQKLLFTEGHQIKFLQPVIPDDTVLLSLTMDWEVVDERYSIRATLEKDQKAVFKLQGIFAAR